MPGPGGRGAGRGRGRGRGSNSEAPPRVGRGEALAQREAALRQGGRGRGRGAAPEPGAGAEDREPTEAELLLAPRPKPVPAGVSLPQKHGDKPAPEKAAEGQEPIDPAAVAEAEALAAAAGAGDENFWASMAAAAGQDAETPAAEGVSKGDLPTPPAAANPEASNEWVTGPPAVIPEENKKAKKKKEKAEKQPGDATGHAAPESESEDSDDEGEGSSGDESESMADADGLQAPDLGEGGVEVAVVKGDGDVEMGFSLDDELRLILVKEGTPAETAGMAFLVDTMKVAYINGKRVHNKSEIPLNAFTGKAVLLGLMRAAVKPARPGDDLAAQMGQLVLHGSANQPAPSGGQLVSQKGPGQRGALALQQKKKKYHYPPPPKIFRPPKLKPLPTFVQMFMPVYKSASRNNPNTLVADKSQTQGVKKEKEKAVLPPDPNAPQEDKDKKKEDKDGQATAVGAQQGEWFKNPNAMGGGGGAPSNPHGKGPGWTPKPPPSMHPDRGLGFDPDRERGTAPGGSTQLSAGRRFRRHRQQEDEYSSSDEPDIRIPEGAGPEGDQPGVGDVIVIDAQQSAPGEAPLLQPIKKMGKPIRKQRGKPVRPPGASDSDSDDRKRQADLKKLRRGGSQDTKSSDSSSSSSSEAEDPAGDKAKPTAQEMEAKGPGIYRPARERPAGGIFIRDRGEAPGIMGGHDIKPGQTVPHVFQRREAPPLSEQDFKNIVTRFTNQYPVPESFNLVPQLKQLDSDGIRSVLRPLLNVGRDPTVVLAKRIDLERRRCRQDQLERAQGATVRDAGADYNVEPTIEEAPDPYTFRYAPRRPATLAGAVVAGVILAAKALEALAEAYAAEADGPDLPDQDSSSSEDEAPKGKQGRPTPPQQPAPPQKRERARDPNTQHTDPRQPAGSAANPFTVVDGDEPGRKRAREGSRDRDRRRRDRSRDRR